MNYLRLSESVVVQISSFIGVFLSIVVSGYYLSDSEFGYYVSSVAISAWVGSLLALGLDRLALRATAKATARARKPVPVLAVCMVILCGVAVSIIALVGLTTWLSLVSVSLRVALVLGVLIAGRLILGGYLRATEHVALGFVGTFGLQPLFVSLIYGSGLAVRSTYMPSYLTGLDSWFVVTLLMEAIQFLFLLFFAIDRSGGVAHFANELTHVRVNMIRLYLNKGVVIAVWGVIAQTGLLSVVLASWLFSPSEVGSYTLAFRLSQLVMFPMTGIVQLALPTVVRARAGGHEKDYAELEKLVVAGFCAVSLAYIGYLIFAPAFGGIVFNHFDGQTYLCGAILGASSVVLAIVGVGDQGLAVLGRQYQASIVSICAIIISVLVFILPIYLYKSLYIYSFAAAFAVCIRAIWAYSVLYTVMRRNVSALKLSVYKKLLS